jgi:hypothetical protein
MQKYLVQSSCVIPESCCNKREYSEMWCVLLVALSLTERAQHADGGTIVAPLAATTVVANSVRSARFLFAISTQLPVAHLAVVQSTRILLALQVHHVITLVATARQRHPIVVRWIVNTLADEAHERIAVFANRDEGFFVSLTDVADQAPAPHCSGASCN